MLAMPISFPPPPASPSQVFLTLVTIWIVIATVYLLQRRKRERKGKRFQHRVELQIDTLLPLPDQVQELTQRMNHLEYKLRCMKRENSSRRPSISVAQPPSVLEVPLPTPSLAPPIVIRDAFPQLVPQ
jgi:hypothetical protein